MNDKHVIIIGGGLAGMSAGCYALLNGYRTTIVEHNLALGGVCTAWPRGPYLIDGCIHWLTGGAYQRVYEELEIVPAVQLHTLQTWATYTDVRDGFELPFTRDLDAFCARLQEAAPEDTAEIERLRQGVRDLLDELPVALQAPQTMNVRDSLRGAWEMRGALGTLMHFRKPIGIWTREHLKSPRLRRVFGRMLPEGAPAMFLLMVLGYLERGYLSRPVGGTAAFRDALERTYRTRGGEVLLNTTVDEVVVKGERATGVRLSDGSELSADCVISTASAPETVLRLLGGQFDAAATRQRMEQWQLLGPIVLASFGVAKSYTDKPALWTIDGVAPFSIGPKACSHVSVRVCNDDPCYAPQGHAVVQALLETDYAFWATRGARYNAEKDVTAERTLSLLEPFFPELRASVRVTDIATPLSFWQHSRSWLGAFEGWMPRDGSMFSHVNKTLEGLFDFYMAGQWVEPGGGVPTAVTSGRQVIELLCRDDQRPFVMARH